MFLCQSFYTRISLHLLHFSHSPNSYQQKPLGSVLGNVYSLLLLLFGTVVSYMVTRPARVTSKKASSKTTGQDEPNPKTEEKNGHVDTNV